MTKRLLLFFIATAASSLFGLEFYVGQVGEKTPEGGFKISNCNFGRSYHYKTDLYKIKPCSVDNLTVRPYQTVEFDQNLNIGGLGFDAPKLVFAKGKTIKLRNSWGSELSSGKIHLQDCNVEIGHNLNFSFWHKRTWGGVANIELENTKMLVKGSVVCVVAVHPEVTLNNRCGSEIVLNGNSQLTFGTGAVIDEIFATNHDVWSFRFKFIIKGDTPPRLTFNEIKARGLEFFFEVKDAKIKPGTYPLVTLIDRDSALSDSVFKLNGQPYTLGSRFSVGGKDARIEFGASPAGKDSKTANDLLLIISK